MMISFVYPAVFWAGLIIFILVYILRRVLHSDATLEWPFVSVVLRSQEKKVSTIWSPRQWASLLRSLALAALLIGVARPQYIDEYSKLPVEGRDIELVIDISGSMALFDDPNNRVTRFDAAKREVMNFIEQRVDDQIGLVYFAATAFSRCPLTYDKGLLRKMVSELEIGILNPQGTVLSAALAVAVNRLRNSSARTKIIVALTDGAPSEYDVAPDEVIAVAKKYGIKIYTIGVGSDEGGYGEHPMFGLVRCQTPLNSALLDRFARETGGAFFRAERPDDIARVYKTIDTLEKSSYEVPRYANKSELFPWMLVIAFLALLIEAFIRARWVLL